MKIIGHRGAAGIALENTLESIRSAIAAGVDAVEIDVWMTKDKHLVLSHDITTRRLGSADLTIPNVTLEELRTIKLVDGGRIPTLEEAIRAVGDTPLIIEAKGSGWEPELAKVLDRHLDRSFSVIAFDHDALYTFHQLRPKIPVYALERWSPFEAVQLAQGWGFAGVDLNFWVLNPLVYRMARNAGLEIIVFTVNYVWIARFLKWLYPDISITTNNPDKLSHLSDIKKSEKAKAKASTKRRRSRRSNTAPS
jgi:glycerophosphoryl diester phosphodiesterase